jgi:hypothetical protein
LHWINLRQFQKRLVLGSGGLFDKIGFLKLFDSGDGISGFTGEGESLSSLSSLLILVRRGSISSFISRC